MITVDPFLNEISQEEKNLFLGTLKPRKLFTGEHYVKEGQYVNTIAFIQDGFLRTYQIDYEGIDTTIEFHAPNSFCGSYYAFYTHQQALDNLVAITPCTLGTISYEQLMQFYDDHLSINTFGRKIIEQVCIAKDFRIAKMLQSDAEQRYLWFMETYPELMRVAQLQHIATFLGIKPETLSRIRRKITS